MKILLNCSLPPAALKQMFQSVNLSRVRKIDSWYVDRSDVEPMTEMMPFITTPCWTRVWGKYCAVFISELTESLIENLNNRQTEAFKTRSYKCNIITCCGVHHQSSKQGPQLV